MFGKNYNGPKEVEYQCTIEKGDLDTDKDITFSGSVKGRTAVQGFLSRIGAQYQLPGLVSLHRPSGEKLNDDWAFIGDIVAADKAVIIRFDPTVSVANGGIADGAWANASSGGVAIARGGFATGGVFDSNGGAQGGSATGGHGRGEDGQGGSAFGGMAYSLAGTAESGDSVGGSFIKCPI